MPGSDSTALAADRALVAEWQRLHAGSTQGLWPVRIVQLRRHGKYGACGPMGSKAQATVDAAWIQQAHGSPLVNRLAARLDEVAALHALLDRWQLAENARAEREGS